MKEAVVFVSQHHNEYYSRSKANGNARFRSFGSPPCRGGFRDIKFADFQSSVGILPIPVKVFPAPVMEKLFSPLTPSPTFNEPKNSKKFAKSGSVLTPIKVLPSEQSFSPKTPCFSFFESKNVILFEKSGTVLNPIQVLPTEQSFSPKTPSFSVDESKNLKKFTKNSSFPIPIKINANFSEMLYSERWAGPTYSNSPPPSSVPIPKFSSRPKRDVLLDLPSSSAPGFKFFPLAKSALTSPNRDCNSPFSGDLPNSDDSASKTLRRILNLDTADE